MSASPKDIMQHLLDQGLLTPEEVREASRLLEEAEHQGQPLPLTQALLRAGVMIAGKAHEAEAALDEARQDPVEAAVAPMAKATGLQLIERIGRGSQAVVYKCRQVDMDRIVAVKVLLTRAARDEKLRLQFIQEARSAAKLSHPNIVTIHEIRPYKDTLYIVMEYVDGGTVHELLAVRKRFDLAEAIAIVCGAAQGLAHAHSRGIIHRDIKPKNIMLTREGVPKLADLGLARHINEAGEEEGKAYGTPYYISPEQITGDPPADFRADLYSLGVTLYQMVTGRPPFMAATPQEIMRMHVIARLPDPREFVPDLPQVLSWLLAKACAREPEDRYASAEDFLAALTELNLSQVETSASAAPRAADNGSASEGRRWPRAAVLEQGTPSAGPPQAKTAATGGKAGEAMLVKVPPSPSRRVWLAAGLASVILLGAGGVAAYVVTKMLSPPPPSPAPTSANESPSGEPPQPAKAPAAPPIKPQPPESPRNVVVETPASMESNARDALQVAKDYEARPNAKIFDVIQAYQNVVQVYPKSKAAEEAQQAIDRLTAAAEQPRPTSFNGPKSQDSAEPASLDADTVSLKAAKAVIHGTKAKYEFAAGRDNIGMWSEEDEWVNWDVKASKPGTFTVEVTYAAIGQCSGNEYTLALGDQQLTGKVNDTGGWGNFRTELLGTIKLAQAGNFSVVVRPKGKPKAALMNLQAVTFKRTGP